MHIERIETVERFSEIELDWDELYKVDPAANIYLSASFLLAIVKRTVVKFRILVAWTEDGRCVGALPLHIKTVWSKSERQLYNVLDMLGHVFDADYTGILCDPAYEAEVCAAFAREVRDMPFGRVILSYFSGPPSRLQAFCESFDSENFDTTTSERKINDGETNNLICPYIDLPDTYSSYLEKLSANSRQKLRRLLRRLHEDPDLRITRSTPATYGRDARILSELWYRRHAARKGEKRAARMAARCSEVLVAGLAGGIVFLPILWRRGEPVAAQANYIDPVKRHALFHVGGRDETIRDLPIGLLLQAHSIRWAIAHDLRRYDFTLGDEPYKYSFGPVDRQIAYLEIATKNGVNPDGRLDEASRSEVASRIRRYSAKGRAEDARVAARQALEVWPDLSPALDVETLITSAAPK